MYNYFRNCKHCGLGIFHNHFLGINFFCQKCWIELEKYKTPYHIKIYRDKNMIVHPLFIWKQNSQIVGDLIHGLKGGTPLPVLKKISLELAQRNKPEGILSKNSVVVPVPSSKVGEKDHAYLIAKIIAEALDIEFWPGLEWKNKKTNHKFLSKTERFIVEMKTACPQPVSKKIILIDDLVTTGATALAAKKAIKGLNQIEVWAVACRL